MNWYRFYKLADKRSFLIQQGYSADIVDWAIGLNSNYAIWLAKMAKNKIVIPGEDDEKLTTALNTFSKFKNKLELKDINRYKSYEQLYLAISPYIQKNSKRQQKSINQTTGAKEILQEGNVKVIELGTSEAAAHLCRDTQWCIKDPKYYEKYNSHSPLYMFTVNEKPYALLNTGSAQFKNIYDRSLNTSEFAKIYKAYNGLYKIKKEEMDRDLRYGYKEDLSVIEDANKYREKIEGYNENELLDIARKDSRVFSFIPDSKITQGIIDAAHESLMNSLKSDYYIDNVIDTYFLSDERLRTQDIKDLAKSKILNGLQSNRSYIDNVEYSGNIPNDLKDANIENVLKQNIIDSMSLYSIIAVPIPKKFIDDSVREKIIKIFNDYIINPNGEHSPAEIYNSIKENSIAYSEIDNFENKMIAFAQKYLKVYDDSNNIRDWPEFLIKSNQIQEMLKNDIISLMHNKNHMWPFEFNSIVPYLIDKSEVINKCVATLKEEIGQSFAGHKNAIERLNQIIDERIQDVVKEIKKEIYAYDQYLMSNRIKQKPILYLDYADFHGTSEMSGIKPLVIPYFESELGRIANSQTLSGDDIELIKGINRYHIYNNKDLFKKAIDNIYRLGYKDYYLNKIYEYFYGVGYNSGVKNISPQSATSIASNWYKMTFS